MQAGARDCADQGTKFEEILTRPLAIPAVPALRHERRNPEPSPAPRGTFPAVHQPRSLRHPRAEGTSTAGAGSRRASRARGQAAAAGFPEFIRSALLYGSDFRPPGVVLD
jgi:hypothetical protein